MKKYIIMMSLATMVMVSAIAPGFAYRAKVEHLSYDQGNTHSVGACFASGRGSFCWNSGAR